MAFEFPCGEKEQQVLDLLQKTEQCASDAQLEHIEYELKSIIDLPMSDLTSILRNSYTALKKSDSYSSVALSLVCYIVGHAMSCSPLNSLQQYINTMAIYETKLCVPRLQLRRLLADIAVELDDGETTNFITLVTNELELNRDRLGKSTQIFQLFEKMEEKGLVSVTRRELPFVTQVLTAIGRDKLLVKTLNPEQPINVAVIMDLQRKFI